jgi:SOS-response transcriptional repressor LexA
VAVRLGNDGTVKTLAHHGGQVVLESANPADGDITVDPGQSFTVLGVVCGVFRPFQELEPIAEKTEEA